MVAEKLKSWENARVAVLPVHAVTKTVIAGPTLPFSSEWAFVVYVVHCC